MVGFCQIVKYVLTYKVQDETFPGSELPLQGGHGRYGRRASHQELSIGMSGYRDHTWNEKGINSNVQFLLDFVNSLSDLSIYLFIYFSIYRIINDLLKSWLFISISHAISELAVLPTDYDYAIFAY